MKARLSMRTRAARFCRLTRLFARGLANNDLIAPAEDLHGTIAGLLSVCIVVGGAVTLTFLSKYNGLATSRTHVTRAHATVAEKLAMAIDDKALLIGGAMIVMALVTVLFWDSLVLDGRDRAVLEPLPVSLGMLLLAKATAVSSAAALVAFALNVLPALLFSIVVFGSADLGLGTVVRSIGAHAVAGFAGCACVFSTLVTLRGLMAIALPASLSRRVVLATQFALVLALLLLLLTSPFLAIKTRWLISTGGGALLLGPPLWFVGLQELLDGRGDLVLDGLARTGLVALAGSLASVCLVHLAILFVRARPVGMQGDSRGSMRRLLARIVRGVATCVARDGAARASFLFTASTLSGSPRHRLYVAGALGLGLAVSGVTLFAAYLGVGINRHALDLTSVALSGQLNLIFFLVVGIRLALASPADLDAGWIFRFHATPALARYHAGTRGAIFFVFVLPLLLVLAPVHVWLWGWYGAIVHLAFGVIGALMLLEVVFVGYQRFPLVSPFTPGRALLSLRFPLYVAGYLVFVYLMPATERLLIQRTGMFYAWVALFVVVIARLLDAQSPRNRSDRMPVFDDPLSTALDLRDSVCVTARGDRAAMQFRDGELEHTVRAGSPYLFGIVVGASREAEYIPALSARVLRLTHGVPPSWTAWTDQFSMDLPRAVRRLWANPALTAFSILTIALGVGATTATYSVLYSTILKPLDVPAVDRLAHVYHANPYSGGSRFRVALSSDDFDDLERSQTVFSHVAAHAPFAQVVVANGIGERAVGEVVSGEYFRVLEVPPALGRMLQAQDDRVGAPPVVVISDRVWRRQFGGQPTVIGRTIRIGGHEFQIVGVAPASFHGVELPNLVPTQLWVPLASASLVGSRATAGDRESRWVVATGRFAPGRTISEARAEIGALARGLDQTYPIGRDLPPELRAVGDVSRPWTVIAVTERLVTERSDASMLRLARLTMIAVGLVLLVACTNLANLMLARGTARRREFAVRMALGAPRWRLIQEQLLEAAMVATLGCAAALVAARALTHAGIGATLRYGPWISIDVSPVLDRSATMAAVSATVLALVIFGLIPALQMTRRGTIAAIGDGAVGASATWRGRRVLIGSQVAVSVALVALTGLCARDMITTASRDTGFDLDRLALVQFDFKAQGWTESRARDALVRIALEANRRGEIDAVAIASGLPVGASVREHVNLATPDRPFASSHFGQRATLIAATPDVFRTFGVAIVSGRPFDERDTSRTAAVIVLSELTARALFGATNAVGRDVLRRNDALGDVETLTVVGIAKDTDSGDIGERLQGVAYVPFAQNYEPRSAIVARASRDARQAVVALEGVTRRLEPELGIVDSGTGPALGGADHVAFEIMGGVAGVLGLLALVLAMTGLYGVLSYVVAQRTHEIGVRIALGAGPMHITRLVVMDGVRPVIEGLVVGFFLADLVQLAMQPVFTTTLPPFDAAVLTSVPIPFLVAGLIASYMPSRRAARQDPSVALRHL